MLVKPICVKCHRFYRPAQNGFAFIEGMPKGQYAPPGLEAPETWKPYKLWMGDKWECPGCGHELVVGVIGGPIREHFQPDFASEATRLGATYQVNDC